MKIISLFSGAGGFDLGMIQAGHSIVWANDNDTDAVATYQRNISNHIVCADIAAIQSFVIPDADAIIGGFPCQGFSHANLKRSANDERNKLYKHFLRIINDKKPVLFLAENVRGILSLDKGQAMQTIVKDFRSCGYRVEWQLFNTADFGVPQTRWRVIIAGIRDDIPNAIHFTFPKPTHTHITSAENGNGLIHHSKIKKEWITVSEALKDISEPNLGITLKNHIYSAYKVTDRNFTGHRMTDPNKPSPTILARGNGRGGVCAMQHPLNHRRMSIREEAVIQTFPIDFEFIGSMGSCYRQVGNAVPVLFAKHLGKALLTFDRKLQEAYV